MSEYIVHTVVTDDELKHIFKNLKKYNIFNQAETLAIVGRSLSSVGLIHKLTSELIIFKIRHNDFHLNVAIDNGQYIYDFNLGYRNVDWLPDGAINLAHYLREAQFSLKIGDKEYHCDYQEGTVGDEIATLLQLHLPDFYNVVSLGVLLDKLANNDIIISAGYIMLFKKNINKENLLSVVYAIPRVTKLLIEYNTAAKLQDFLILAIEKEILHN